jgi:hypothetical protein
VALDNNDRSLVIDLTDDEIEVYNSLNLQKLFLMLPDDERLIVKTQILKIKTEDFPLRKEVQFIRETLKNKILIPKTIQHNYELNRIAKEQIKTIKMANDLITSGNFESADLTMILHQITKNVR